MNDNLYTREARIFVNEHHDKCSVCNHPFVKDDSTHIGLDTNGEYQYVGDCCLNRISTLICNHAYCPRGYTQPEPQAKLWRFMDLGKFLSLIQTETLYFARADTFDDPFEGAKGNMERKSYWDAWYAGYFWSQVELSKETNGGKKANEDSLETAKRLVSELNANNCRNRTLTYINCWHENEYESEAMWNLYTKNLDEGIAIQTTFKNVYEAIDKDPSIEIGKVKYIDYAKQFAGLGINSFFYKRKSFEHEKEVRLVLSQYSENEVDTPIGIAKHVDLDKLIESVYLSPTCKSWFYKVVKDIMKKYKIRKKICQSRLGIAPFY